MNEQKDEPATSDEPAVPGRITCGRCGRLMEIPYGQADSISSVPCGHCIVAHPQDYWTHDWQQGEDQ